MPSDLITTVHIFLSSIPLPGVELPLPFLRTRPPALRVKQLPYRTPRNIGLPLYGNPIVQWVVLSPIPMSFDGFLQDDLDILIGCLDNTVCLRPTWG